MAMAKFQKDKKTALKLLGKYADSYNSIVEENKGLKQELEDLRYNIKISKEIINGFFSNSEDKNILTIKKLHEETTLLYAQNEKLSKENSKLRSKLQQIETIKSESYERIKEELSNANTKLFILEQEITKKSNIIAHLKRKVPKEENDEKSFPREIQIIDPSKAVVQINDELLLYKSIYSKLLQSLKRNQIRKAKLDETLIKLRDENSKLRNKFRMQILSANREKETILSFISHNSKSKAKTDLRNFTIDETMIRKKLRLNTYNKKSSEIREEFCEVLKNCGLTIDEFERFSKIKGYNKVTEVVEMLYKLINEKNMSINLLENENDNLINKNFQLNRENMNLSAQLAKLKTDIANNANNKNGYNTTYDVYNDTLSNNQSHITPNRNMNVASIVTYKKLLEKQQEKEENEEEDDNEEEEEDYKNISNIPQNEKEFLMFTDSKKDDIEDNGISSNENEEEEYENQSEEIYGSKEKYCYDNGTRKINRNRKGNYTIESVTSSEFKKNIDNKENNNSKNFQYFQKIQNKINSFASGVNEDINNI